MAFYAYTRVSTSTQAEKGGGLDVQEQGIRRYCDQNGIVLDKLYTDAGISGALKDTDEDDALSKRPSLVEMIASLKEGDTVIVWNTSRLWRSDTAKVFIRRELKRAKAKVISVEEPRFDLYTTNPNDKLFDALIEAMDQWERDTIVLKLAKGRATKAVKGDKPAGLCPMGYQYAADKKSIIVNPDEAPAVKLMFTEAQKGRTLSEIAETLTAKGYKARRGGDWTRGSVQAVLRNRFYIGELTHQGKTITGNHDALISKIQFGKVQSQLRRRHK